MRKFLPRFFNIICFILALMVLLPWNQVSLFFVWLSEKLNNSEFVLGISKFFIDYQALKLFYIPAFMVLISLLSLIISLFDKKSRKVKSPLCTNIIAPLAYYGIAASLFGAINSFFLKTSIIYYNTDFLGLGKFLTQCNYFNNEYTYISSTIEWLAVALIISIGAVIVNKNVKTNGFKKIFSFILFTIFLLISYKAIDDSFGNPGLNNIKSFITLPNGLRETNIMSNDYTKYIESILALLFLVLYIIIGPIKASLNTKKTKETVNNEALQNSINLLNANTNKEKEHNKEKQEEVKPEEIVENKNSIINEIDNMVSIPKPEDVIETEVEEKTVIKQVVYEKHDLDKMFNTNFNFEHCFMVKKGDTRDYFVNKVKFLTITNKGHTLSFRLELDKAIRLIIQYPLIGKDKYENHKIWFKIEDIAILSNEVVANIIKDAYETVLSNN